MSLDNIQFPPIIMHNLFNKTLYDLSEDTSESKNTTKDAISFLGNNQQNITILVNHTDAIYLPDDTLNFLLGILNACKLSMADVSLVNKAKNENLTYQAVAEQLKADKIIMFGIKPGQMGLPLEFPDYQVQKFNNQVYVSSPALPEIQADVEEKKKLWNSLKKILSI